MKRGRVRLALGDAIGANLTTVTLVLGLVLTFSPSIIEQMIFAEILVFVLVSYSTTKVGSFQRLE
jgi:Ca2+/Na+ antiporter